ncbi:RNA ligase family protein [Bdellovibrionales bacterium]|nr:RNA ligase family protein [Bdellovibrionales bacterium]MDC0980298.1 RNA ligase family protein [Bdellovibrionales bacterium]
MKELTDFPKVYCPFIRKTFKVNEQDWSKHGRALGLRKPEAYLVINKINPGYEWVFDDKDTFAVEKLDGTNVKLKTDDGRLVALQNRKNIIDPLQVMKGKTFIIEGIFRSIQKGYMEMNGIQTGELIGPKLQGNPYKIDNHEWYPFEKAITALTYKSFDEHERNFENWSSWFKNFLRSRYFMKTHKVSFGESVFAEGVIFYNLRRRDEGKSWMAKLRRDMFDWYYEDLKILNYNPNEDYNLEDQDKFD